jgi:lysophospholipase L1-like esterase
VPGVKRLLIFGDSYVAAADRGRPGYARLAPLLLGWRGAHIGVGGTGFVKASGNRRPYPDRLADLLSREADVVVVQASGNDAVCDLSVVEQAAETFVAATVERFPSVLLLGPMWALDGSEHLPELRKRLRAAADRTGVRYVDTSGWLRARWIGSDGAHPTWAGHARLAWLVARAVRRSCRPRGR